MWNHRLAAVVLLQSVLYCTSNGYFDSMRTRILRSHPPFLFAKILPFNQSADDDFLGMVKWKCIRPLGSFLPLLVANNNDWRTSFTVLAVFAVGYLILSWADN